MFRIVIVGESDSESGIHKGRIAPPPIPKNLRNSFFEELDVLSEASPGQVFGSGSALI
jgi:hypothetical protein